MTIGGDALASRTVVGSTQITGTTPAAISAGAKEVVVASTTNGSGKCSGCFSYVPTATAGQIAMISTLSGRPTARGSPL